MNVISACQSERGAALVISLMFLAILAMLGATAMVLTTTDIQIGGNYKASEQAFYQADAGVNYGIGKIEEELAANPDTYLPKLIGDPTDPTDSSSVFLSGFSAPSGFSFSYKAPGLTKIAGEDNKSTADDVFLFTIVGTDPNNTGATATITATLKRKPAIQFGAFGDKKLDLGNTAAVYSYSYTDDQHPEISGISTGEGDVGSNESVILRNNSYVDGDVSLGENAGGTDATLTDQGGVVSGTNGEDIDRVDPDPLGVVGGEYAVNFITYSTTNDNETHAVVKPGDSINTTGASLTVGPNETLTLKGKPGGSNFYWHDVLIKSDFLYIDTTNGPVYIYITGSFEAENGSQVINTIDTTCADIDAAWLYTCHCCDTATPSPNDTCQRGRPSDFAIFANSQSNTDLINIANSTQFSGLIYAPYLTVLMNNSADIYGAIMGGSVEINNNVTIYYDTDMADSYTTKDLLLTSWREVRN